MHFALRGRADLASDEGAVRAHVYFRGGQSTAI